ncbi:hypothetical protein [Halalkalicoccus subterraneus]|uniref:hypothetical protein n=1 Tax=Halalkalicoccus subterraneus TaxID=2675002 RepID=UPI000EFAD8BF|nr:hypothetical protein [Halalkalicoccus subterraneus]
MLSAIRTHLPGLVLWVAFAYLSILLFEVAIFGRAHWASYVPSAIGCGIGLYAASRVIPFSARR